MTRQPNRKSGRQTPKQASDKPKSDGGSKPRRPARQSGSRPTGSRPSGGRPTGGRQGGKGGPRGWDAVADWYHGWAGGQGSDHHQHRAIPAALELLQLQKGEHLIDLGCGAGVFAPYAVEQGARYTGVDVSPRLIRHARKDHGQQGRFLVGDARKLRQGKDIDAGSFDAALFLLSIQDMDPLPPAIQTAAWALRDGGRLVIVMTHPCFRIPRLTGWGFDEGRKLQYRRIDRYLSAQPIPMKAYSGTSGTTMSFHRPLSEYVSALASSGLLIDAFDELTTHALPNDKAARRAEEEIPLFAALRARKQLPPT